MDESDELNEIAEAKAKLQELREKSLLKIEACDRILNYVQENQLTDPMLEEANSKKYNNPFVRQPHRPPSYPIGLILCCLPCYLCGVGPEIYC